MITIYTLIPAGSDSNPWFEECLSSAIDQGKHVLLDVPVGKFFQARKQVYTNQGRRNGLVACLDWDDSLQPKAISICERALTKYPVGCAFTYQAKIDADGVVLSEQTSEISRLTLSSVPESIHHLCVINTSYIPVELFAIIEKIAPICIDWLVRAYVALRFGAIQVPMIGYHWRMHIDQTTRILNKEFEEQIPYARALARTWLPLDAKIAHGNFPVYADI